MPRVLQAVALVLGRHPAAEALPHLAEAITSFLGPSPILSLCDACKLGSADLMNWIWEASSDFVQMPTPGWSLCNFLQSDNHYYQWQFSQCLVYEAERGDLELVGWLFIHFTNCQVPQEVVRVAANKGHLLVLQFLLSHDFGIHGTENEGPATKKWEVESEEGNIDVRSQITVNWGSRNVEQTLRKGHQEVARWFYEHAPKGEYDHGDDALEGIIREALNVGDMEFAESIVPQGRHVLDYAMDCKSLEVIERLVEGGYFERDNFSAARAIAQLARTDRLDLIDRISAQQDLPPDHSDGWEFDWHRALSAACSTGNLSLVKWLVEHPMGREAIEGMESAGLLPGLLCRAAERGHVIVMDYLYDEVAIDKYTLAMFSAIREDQLESVKWLVEHFPQSEKIPDYCVMDEAAKLGRLDILQYLHSLVASVVPGWAPIRTSKRLRNDPSDSEFKVMVISTDSNLKVCRGAFQHQSDWRSTDPMDHAAANGHLDLVQWFHSNRLEGCSTAAINAAAANGHLEIVQWFSTNRSEIFTTKAMDGAASNGNLDVVKWLHANVKAGCTKDAMDGAAWNGHFGMLKWLHANRSEGCTANAIEGAVGKGHLQVACWLQMHYTEYSPANIRINLFALNKFEIFLFVRAHYAYIFTPTFIRHVRGNCAHQNPNGNNEEIVAWLHSNYP